MTLLERDDLIRALRAEQRLAANGSGRVVVVSGEAGAGKTALTRAAFPDAVWGYCEPLGTPRPLGPFRDIAAALWSSHLPRATPLTVAARLLTFLREPSPPLVVEDAQWIDTSSSDVLRFLGRRIGSTSGLLVVITRDERPAGSAVTPVLGDLGSHAGLVRLQVPALSPDGIAQLVAGTGLDVGDVVRLTGGNAFLVSHLVADDRTRSTSSLRESVAARLVTLPTASQQLAELLSVAPGRVPIALITDHGEHVDALVAAGLIRVDGQVVEFRHELVRRTVEAELPVGRRRALHEDMVRRLRDANAEPALLAHHAREAHQPDVALAAEMEAAQRAAAFGSHREAAEHYARAADAARIGLPVPQRVRLLLSLAREAAIIAHEGRAYAAAERALRLSRTVEDPLLRSAAARTLSRIEPSEATALELARLAIEYAEPHGRTSELCAAYATFATNRMLARDLDTAVRYARQAAQMALELGEGGSEVLAANALGSALLLQGEAAGEVELRRAIHLAAARGDDHEVGRAYANLVSGAGEARMYTLSARAAREAMSFFTARDLDAMAFYTRGWAARCLFEQGRWDEALTELSILDAADDKLGSITRLVTRYLAARLAIRRGNGDGQDAISEAEAIAATTGSLQRLAPAAATRAEADWLAERPTDVDQLHATYQLAVTRSDPWATGELGYWLWRFDELAHLPAFAAAPFRLHAAGDTRAAAQAWAKIGCPYEQACALADSEQEDDLRTALQIFGRLGASPNWRRTAQRLRKRGARSIPREPRTDAARRRNGLTTRESEILQWILTGRTDADIATQLHLSIRTVEHHVAAILRKEQVTNRRELLRRAREKHQVGDGSSP